MRISRNFRNRQPDGVQTLGQKVASILRKYGTDAHVYLPGIGVINGLTAGNYLDSAGTTAATVDNPVGLVLDAAISQLGSELVVNGSFAADTDWTKGTGWTISGGTANFSGASGSSLSQSESLVAGKSYLIVFDLSGSSISCGVSFSGGGADSAPAFTTAGTKICYITCTANRTAFNFNSVGGTNFSIDNISVREVTGIHALQATTANKPILRLSGGRYYFDFVDGTDVLTATFPAGYESATIINTAETGQVTYTGQNIVGAYDMRGAVIGSELAENGTFDTDTLWNKGTGWTISGGTANFNSATGSSLTQNETLVIGKSYLVVFDLSGASISCSVSFSGGGADSVAAFTTAGRKSAVITCTANRTAFNFNGLGGANFSIDNVSVKEITQKEYARFIFRTGLTASELTTMQTFANRLAGV